MAETKSFCPLHLHSYYSFQDALSSPKEIAKRAKELGYPATALTDHGHCHGLIKMYKECKKNGIKLIPSCELYITPIAADKDRKSHHLTMLVQNDVGLSNLYKILSWANLPPEKGGGFYHRPRTEWSKLEQFSEGLICLSGCMSSIVNAPFVEGNIDEARKNAIHLMEIYGKERFFIEVQDVNDGETLYIPEQKAILEFGRSFAKEFGLKCVASNDSHFINKEDAFSHEVLKTIGSRCTLADPIRKHGEKTGRMVYSGYFYYLPSYEEMVAKFSKEEVENSKLIADMVNVEIPLKQNHMPRFDPNLTDEQVFDKLRHECFVRYKQLGIENKPNKKEYIDRITKELKDIKEAGLQNYLMIVWDVVRFCRENKIPVGMGRGSAGGSIVSYLLKITGMDPIVYGLIWERFWNRGRKGSMPDIDLDISIDRREEVVEYLKNKFGRDKVFPMVTFTTMATKAALKDVGKVMGLDFEYMNELTKHVPHKCKSIDDAIERDDYIRECASGIDKDVNKWMTRIETLKINKENNITINENEIKILEDKINNRSKQLRKTFEVAKNLEDIARQKSCHACALLISDENIFGKIPVCYDPRHKKVLTAFDMYDLEELGYLKLDILGLKTLTAVIMTHQEGLDAVKSYDDPEVFSLISSGNTKGVFQLESPLGRQWCQKMKPQTLEEIAALISIIRPAVLEQGLAADYLKNRANPSQIEYLHPDLEPILGPTNGAMIYQETMLEVVKKFAGFDLAKADLLRKAAGKKLPEEMAKYEKDFIEGCLKNNYSDDLAKSLWEWINATADYSFNKSHAIGYGIMSYITAWMKRYKTKEFFTSLFKLSSNEPDSQNEISELFYDAKLFGVEVCPPSIEATNEDFELIDGKIYYGLGHIKSIGKASITKLKTLKPQKWEDVINCIYKINKSVIYGLILSGSFDCFGITRRLMKSQVDFVLELTDKEKSFFDCLLEGKDYQDKKKTVVIAGQNSFNVAVDLLKTFIETENETIKIINSRRALKVLDICNKYLQNADKGEMDIREKAAWELFYLGIPITCSEVDIYSDIRKTNDLMGVKREIDEKNVSTLGIISRITEKTDKRGDKFVFITLDDKSYKMDAAIWSQPYAQYKDIIEVGKAIYVEGIKRKGLFQINKIESL